MQGPTHCCYKDLMLVPDPATLEFEAIPKAQATEQHMRFRLAACRAASLDKRKFFASQLIRLQEFVRRILPQSADELQDGIKKREWSEGFTIAAIRGGNWRDGNKLVDILKLARLFPNITANNKRELKQAVIELQLKLQDNLPVILNTCEADKLQEVVQSLLLYDPTLQWVHAFLGLNPQPARVVAIFGAIKNEAEAGTLPPQSKMVAQLFTAANLIITEFHAAHPPHPGAILQASLWLMSNDMNLANPGFLITPHILLRYFCKKIELTHCNEGECLIGQMLLPFLQSSLPIDWIRELFDITPDSPLLDTIVEKYVTFRHEAGKRYQLRFQQLRRVFHRDIGHSAVFRFALFIEAIVAPTSYIASRYYPKADTRLVHSFFVEPVRKDIMVLDDESAPAVTPALPQFTGRVALYIPNDIRQPAGPVLELRSESAHAAALLHQQVSGRRGIAPLYGRCDYLHKEYSFISLVMPKTPITLKHLYEGEFGTMVCPTDHQILSLLLDLAYGISWIHQAFNVHGGISLEAAQLYLTPERRVQAAVWYQFGASFRTNQDPSHTFLQGFYGKPAFTAPELYKCGPLLPQDFRAVDMWALGCLFYLLIFQQHPLWMLSSDQLVPFESQEAYFQVVRNKVEPRHQELRQMRQRSSIEQLEFVLLQMLRLNPRERLLIGKVVEELEAILRTLQGDNFLRPRLRRAQIFPADVVH